MKKFCSITLCLTMLFLGLITFNSCGSSVKDDWATIIVGENVPTPQKGKLKSGSNLDDYFSGSVDNVSEEYYNEYVNACVDVGYIVDAEKSGNSYGAFNNDGYKISLSYIGGSMYIIIESPEELSEIVWPTTGIGTKLPIPASDLGKVISDSSNCFKIMVGNTTVDNYNDYVRACEQNGFLVDYIKNAENYSAKNDEGFRLNLNYVGCNRMEIMIQTPKEETVETIAVDGSTTTTTTTVATTTQASADEPSSNGLRPEFKAAMDSYEEYMDEYVIFMKKYNANPADFTLLANYAKMVAKYAEMTEDFEEWEDDLNDEETKYYLEVQSRVTQKLLEIAG